MPDESLVSCLCVTRNRVPLLRRAISCFLRQSYAPRELVVLYESDDAATRDYLATLDEPSILPMEAPVEPKMSLGELRNFAVKNCNGYFVAQWDDDDWYAPDRLAEQIDAIRKSGKAACVLTQWLMFDELRQIALLSAQRTWEGSLVAVRDAMPPYPALSRAEDTPLIVELTNGRKLVFLNRPDLYIYVFHGTNTWDRTHWETNLAPYARPLAPAASEKVKTLLALNAARPV